MTQAGDVQTRAVGVRSAKKCLASPHGIRPAYTAQRDLLADPSRTSTMLPRVWGRMAGQGTGLSTNRPVPTGDICNLIPADHDGKKACCTLPGWTDAAGSVISIRHDGIDLASRIPVLRHRCVAGFLS